MRKIITVILLVLLAASGGVAYYLYNKGPVDVMQSNAVEISAVNLYNQFINDSTEAGKKYTGEVLEVTGLADAISETQQHETVILLRTAVEGAHVNCTLEQGVTAKPGKGTVCIKGICSGIGQGDADLGLRADVYLTRCVIVNK